MELAGNRETRRGFSKVGDRPSIFSIEEEGTCETELFRVRNLNLHYEEISIKGPRRNLAGKENTWLKDL